MRRRASVDPILHATRQNGAWTTLVLIPIGLVLPYGMAPYDPLLPPLLVWGVGVAPLVFRQCRRPLYPFCRSDLGPTRTLSFAQGRALTYLKHSQGRAIGFWVAAGMGALVLLAVAIGRLVIVPYPPLAEYAAWPRYQQLTVSVVAGLTAALVLGLATTLTILSVSAACLLRRWVWIQAQCEPWPVGRTLRREFSCALRGDDLGRVQYTASSTEPLDFASKPIRWGEGVGILCYLIGWPGLTLSLTQVVDLILAPDRYPQYPEGAVLRMLMVPTFFVGIICLGRYLRRKS